MAYSRAASPLARADAEELMLPALLRAWTVGRFASQQHGLKQWSSSEEVSSLY